MSLMDDLPSSINEGEALNITVKIDLPLHPSPTPEPRGEARCYMERGEICIEGGIFVYETFNDSEEGVLVEELIAFVFRGGHKTRNMSHTVVTDCSTNLGRTITIEALNITVKRFSRCSMVTRVGRPSSKTPRTILPAHKGELGTTVPNGGSTEVRRLLRP